MTDIVTQLKTNMVSMPPETVAELLAAGATAEQMREIWIEYARGYEEGRQEARHAVKARLQGILNSPEGKARPDFAKRLAFDTDLDADTAVRLLAASPEETPAKTSRLNRLDAAIASAGGSPNVGSEFSELGEGAASIASRIANY